MITAAIYKYFSTCSLLGSFRSDDGLVSAELVLVLVSSEVCDAGGVSADCDGFGEWKSGDERSDNEGEDDDSNGEDEEDGSAVAKDGFKPVTMVEVSTTSSLSRVVTSCELSVFSVSTGPAEREDEWAEE